MDWLDRHPILAVSMLLSTVLIISFLLAYSQAALEAASYRKCCEAPVTAWDALFLDLRIDECGSE